MTFTERFNPANASVDVSHPCFDAAGSGDTDREAKSAGSVAARTLRAEEMIIFQATRSLP